MKAKIQKSYRMFIGGKWTEASDKAVFTTKSPATGAVLASVPQATEKDVDKAVKAAQKAFLKWKLVPAAERAKILNKIAEIIDENTEFLAQVESMADAEAVRKLVHEKFPKIKGEIGISSVGTVIGAHTGPGTVALYFMGDMRTE